MSKTLQAQGVPIPDRLTGPGARNASQTPSNRGTTPVRRSTPQRTSKPAAKSVGYRQSRSASLSGANPATLGASSASAMGGSDGSGVGLLEAEFLIAGFLLVMLMFANTDSSLADKIMSTMKRGTLICAVFFVLALIAGVGPHASKFAKAFGALVIVAIVVTAPVGTVLTDLDNIVKNDWIGSTEHGTDVSADSGTGSSTKPAPQSNAQKGLSEAEKLLKLVGQPGGPLASQAEKGIKAIIGFFS